MLVIPKDLQELDEPSGSRFQTFVSRLVLQEALACEISPTAVDADYRTTYKDGGCDIFVGIGQTASTASLIPDKPSIWSIKAGRNGIDPKQLAKELKPEKHPRLIRHLKDGHQYIWCALHPAGQIERNALRNRADNLAINIGVDASLIRFVWTDHICTALNRYPNLIAEQLPILHSIIGPMMTLTQWKGESPDKKGLRVPFVDLPGSKELQDRLRSHLLGNGDASVFHLAGLSGIGKTRLTIETCLSHQDLMDVLYIGAYSKIDQQLWRRLNSPDTSIKLIIDEVPLEEVTRLQDRFAGYGNRIRIVSIGPAPRGQVRRQRDPMLQQLEPPDEEGGVLPVVTAAAPDLSESICRSIAHFAGHDLRLALLLVDATLRNGLFSTAPLRDFDEVWTRIMWLFRSQIQDPMRFRELYELLTLAVDIGHADSHRSELNELAAFFSKDVADFDKVIRDANECGLGDRLQSFFETKPAALAVWLFQERLWPVLRHRIQAFVETNPSPRLLRRFLERCQQTATPFREEIESDIGRFFLILLGNPALETLAEREPSRIFQTWAEFDPQRGLEWLAAAVYRASDDDLNKFTGDPDGSGGWRGRRQIVWLCEHMACFAEYFSRCEHILFRLAQVETEVRIGNNSSNTWQEMFLPVLANTEVPFLQRLELLGNRLKAATSKTIDLILSAFFRSIERFTSRMQPPSIVGGRIVPDQWQPGNFQELEQCRLQSATLLLESISSLPGEIARYTVQSVVTNTEKFLSQGIVKDFRRAIQSFLQDDSLKRLLLVKMDEWLSWYDRDEKEAKPLWHTIVRAWRNELAPATLHERVKDVTSREYWSVYRVTRRKVSDGEADNIYSNLAKELLHNIEDFKTLSPWLSTSEAVSAPNLFNQLGLNDSKLELLTHVTNWLLSGLNTNLVAHYLNGVRKVMGELPKLAIETLDDVGRKRPADVVLVTLLADISDMGARRILAVVRDLGTASRMMLRQLGYDHWKNQLTNAQKVVLLEQLCDWTEQGDLNSVRIAVDIASMWLNGSTLPADLTKILLRLIGLSALPETNVDDHDWQEVMAALAVAAPQKVAVLLTEEMTNIKSRRYERREGAQKVLELIAREKPEIAMNEIGKWILDDQRGVIFRIFDFKGLFDVIGTKTVKPWVERHGIKGAIGIARSLNGPELREGIPYIPELADWLLSTYHHDSKVFSEFAMGRHSGVSWGHPRDRLTEVEKFLASFDAIQKAWVQDWIKYERDEYLREMERHDKLDEESDRL